LTSRREKLEKMLSADPADPFLNYGLALEHREAGDIDAALAGLRRVVELDPNYVAAYLHQGQLLAGRGETEQAREILRTGIETAAGIGDDHARDEMTGLLDSLA